MPVRTLCELDDPLLRRSFHAGGQPARAQVGGRSRCPWVTAGDRSFPPVLARIWHASVISTDGCRSGICRGGMGQTAWVRPVPSGSTSGMRRVVPPKPRVPSLFDFHQRPCR